MAINCDQEEGYIEWNSERGVYEQFDDDGVFMYTVSSADIIEEDEGYDQFAEMHDAGMSLRDFR